MFKTALRFLSAGSLLAALTTSPAQASDASDKAALAALALLGVAAFSHHNEHYREGRAPQTAQEHAEFERGYRDGLYGEPYDGRYGHYTAAYGDGYAAGHKERDNRLAHKTRHQNASPNAPTLSMRSCVGEASANWNLNPRAIHVVDTVQAASDDFYVEVAAGHRHGVCEVSAAGKIYLFQNGRMQR